MLFTTYLIKVELFLVDACVGALDQIIVKNGFA